MLQKHEPTPCWGIGLSDQQQALLLQLLGEEQSLTVWPLDAIPGQREMEEADPCVLWLSAEANRHLCGMNRDATRHLALLPKVLLLGENYSLADFETACDNGISEILRPPFSREKTLEVLHRALEARNLHHDMLCMSREIVLERELLERKNELLGFLVNFLTNTSGSLDLDAILASAFKGLGELFPARAMHAALWQRDETGMEVSLHICATDTQAALNWRDALLEQTRLLLGENFSLSAVHRLALPHQDKAWADAAPGNGSIISLPIAVGTQPLGVLMLLVEMERSLGRDQVMALDSAIRHLALNITNARRFQTMQLHADYDSLTNVHSRRHFEGRLNEEISKSVRYGQAFSMIMLDIDHFKQVNDTRGHHAGDTVLREVASIISDTIRNTDYCARYGGEEFAILLPCTDSEKGLILAERLRNRIARQTFHVSGGPLKITISLGLAHLPASSENPRRDVVCEADAALYEAKARGRNRTCRCMAETGNGRYSPADDERSERAATVV